MLPQVRKKERRRAARTLNIIAYGKLQFSGIERSCQVRNISPTGAYIEMRGMPQVGQRVWIELRGLLPTPAVVAWRDGERGGLTFETRQDLLTVFEARAGEPTSLPRSPRFALYTHAEVAGFGGAARLEVIDISLGGLKLVGRTDLDVDAVTSARLDGLGDERSGRVRWKRGTYLGLHFDHPLTRDDLFQYLACSA